MPLAQSGVIFSILELQSMQKPDEPRKTPSRQQVRMGCFNPSICGRDGMFRKMKVERHTVLPGTA
jgi:hypothetical protein